MVVRWGGFLGCSRGRGSRFALQDLIDGRVGAGERASVVIFGDVADADAEESVLEDAKAQAVAPPRRTAVGDFPGLHESAVRRDFRREYADKWDSRAASRGVLDDLKGQLELARLEHRLDHRATHDAGGIFAGFDPDQGIVGR